MRKRSRAPPKLDVTAAISAELRALRNYRGLVRFQRGPPLCLWCLEHAPCACVCCICRATRAVCMCVAFFTSAELRAKFFADQAAFTAFMRTRGEKHHVADRVRQLATERGHAPAQKCPICWCLKVAASTCPGCAC